MIQIVFQIIVIAIAAVWFAELSMLPQMAAKWTGRSRVKPFDCPLCLAWWSALVWFAASGNGFAALVLAACTSTIAVWVSKKIHE